MPNFTKSFNLRNGVQVDDSNFIVNANGLVGIGSSVPLSALDVVGNVRATGFTSTSTLNVRDESNFGGNLTIGNISINPSTGIITGATFFGDGSNMDGVIAIATAGFIRVQGPPVGLVTDSFVGLATDLARSQFQVGAGPGVGNFFTVDANGNVSYSGTLTGVESVGNGGAQFGGAVSCSSSITAAEFYGNITGNLTGSASSATNSNNSTLVNGKEESNLSVGFAETAANLSSNDGSIEGLFFQAPLSGVATFSGVLLDNFQITSTIPATNPINYFGNGNNLTDINAANVTGILPDNVYPPIILTNINSTVGISTVNQLNTTSNLEVGGNLLLNSDTSGIYVNIEAPANPDTRKFIINDSGPVDVHFVNNSNTSANLHLGIDNTNFNNQAGGLRYGNSAGNFPFSTRESLDVLNYGSGNINYIIEADTVVRPNPGYFNWIRGASTTTLMTLTAEGNLGLGNTNPTEKLNVQGISKFSSNATFDANVTVEGDLQIGESGNITAPAGLIANINGNVNSSGISTFSVIGVSGISTFSNGLRVGVASTAVIVDDSLIQVGDGRPSLEGIIQTAYISGSGQVGIQTNLLADLNVGLNAPQTFGVFKGIGVGVTQIVGSSVDFANAGVATSRFLLPPNVTTVERDALQNLIPSALVYNTTTQNLEIYDGSNWNVVTLSGVGASGSNPVGTIIQSAAQSAPNGYILCDGREISRTTFANLFTVIGETFGSGDGNTTFNIPDMRGQFVRGYDPSGSVDPDGSSRGFGSIQVDALQQHIHETELIGSTNGSVGIATTTTGQQNLNSDSGEVDNAYRTSTETRPTNIALNHYIAF